MWNFIGWFKKVGIGCDGFAAECVFGLLQRKSVNRRRYAIRAETRIDVFEYTYRRFTTEESGVSWNSCIKLQFTETPPCRGKTRRLERNHDSFPTHGETHKEEESTVLCDLSIDIVRAIYGRRRSDTAVKGLHSMATACYRYTS